jgi:hypothetical protein
VLTDYAAYYAIITVLIFFVFIISGACFVWGSFAMMSVLKKAQHPQPWAAWVPFYREFVFLELGGQSGWFIFLSLASGIIASLTGEEYGIRWILTMLLGFVISAAAAVFWIFAIVNINRASGKHVLGFTILGVLVPLVWLSILAWDRSSFAANLATGPFVPGRGRTFLETISATTRADAVA